MKRFSFAVVAAAALLVLTGAGCRKSDTVTTPSSSGASPTIQVMRAGDKVVLQEPAAVIDGKYVAESFERRVTINGFVMGKSSEGSYELAKEQDAKKVLASGGWQHATLNTTHSFYLPGVMDAKTRPIDDSAVLFLAREEYRELAATSGTTLDPRFTEEVAWRERMKANPAALRGYEALVALIREADNANKDLTYARRTGPVERTVRVNGQDVKAKVYTLKNWYGTFEVLDHADVPLVLSFRLDPQVDRKRLDVSKGDGAALASLVNYQVKELVYTDR